MNLLERTRAHRKHFTVTGYVVNPQRTKLLVIKHKKLGKWLPPGGHLEENEVPHLGVLREVVEETGIKANLVIPEHTIDLEMTGAIDMQIPAPHALLYQVIPADKHDQEHIHLDMAFVLEAGEEQVLTHQESEVAAARWWTKAELINSNDVFDSVRSFARNYLS
jgi:ADP-ribose pyrophosphatase YjhB (NUDIX family)